MVFSPNFLCFPAVIKMEGGTEHDLRILEQEEEEERTEKAEGPKKEEPRPPEPPGKGPTERPDGDDSAKVGGFGVPVGILGFPGGFWCPLESLLSPGVSFGVPWGLFQDLFDSQVFFGVLLGVMLVTFGVTFRVVIVYFRVPWDVLAVWFWGPFGPWVFFGVSLFLWGSL